MTDKRFTMGFYDRRNEVMWIKDEYEDLRHNKYDMSSPHNVAEICAKMNELHEENMDLRAKHTQMIIIMKDVVKDLKRMDTYRYAEHLEKIANLHFLSEKELEE